MNNRRKYQATRLFAGAFAKSLAESLTQACGLPWDLEVLDSARVAEEQTKSIDFRLTVEGPLRGECFVEFYQPQVAELSSKILGQPVSPFSDEHGEALATVISSAMAELNSALVAEYGVLSFRVDRVEDVRFDGMFFVPLAASGGDRSDISVLLYFDDRLLETLSSLSAVRAMDEEGQASIDPTNLKLVMEVELNVSLRFGQCQLPLREVLNLASGSVIELDHDVDDPVELLLDGKVIARGEAVIVDGNYGLRVTEIPQPMASHLIR